jgi:hypothetical protein
MLKAELAIVTPSPASRPWRDCQASKRKLPGVIQEFSIELSITGPQRIAA